MSIKTIKLINSSIITEESFIPLINTLLSVMCIYHNLSSSKNVPESTRISNIEYSLQLAFGANNYRAKCSSKNPTNVTKDQYKIAQSIYRQEIIDYYLIKRDYLKELKNSYFYIAPDHNLKVKHIVTFCCVQLHTLPLAYQIPERL